MEPIIELFSVSVYYSGRQVLRPVTLAIPPQKVTAIMGPSGCGKSTLLKTMNRMNELVYGSRTEGRVVYKGMNIYSPDVDPTDVRCHIGMIFQKPNPLPKSIYDNVAFGPRLNGYRGNMDEIVEQSLTEAALWGEVKDSLRKSPYNLSGGQQQRLCIARALATNPDVLLMDEPCSSLDPVATGKIEDLIKELAEDRTVVLVTHNIQQTARIANWIAFLNFDKNMGYLHHFGSIQDTFVNPRDEVIEAYVTGRFG